MNIPFAVLAAFLSLSTTLNAEGLRLLNWEDYLSDEVKNRWAEQGPAIEEILYDNDEQRDSSLIKASSYHIDLAIVDEIVGARFGREGKFIEINETNVPGLKDIDPFWRDRCGQYAMPYLWGTLGIAYRSDVVKQAPDSWKDILEPTQALKGHIGMLEDYTDMLAPALFYQGLPLNTGNKEELKTAFSILKKQAPDVLTYQYPITFLGSHPQAKDLHMTVVYGGDQYSMNETVGKPGLWKYSVPKEGTVLWVDCIAITSSSQNQAMALKFLNFINRPDIAAKNAQALYYASPNSEASNHLAEAYRTNPEVYPPKSVIDRSQLYKELSNENIELRLRITHAVVNIHESRKAR